MDDAWLHTVGAAAPSYEAQPAQHHHQHRRKQSLLQQPTEAKPDLSTNTLSTVTESAPRYPSPPKATLARRAQSYTDFYNVVQSIRQAEEPALVESKRRPSLDSQRKRTSKRHVELDFISQLTTVEDQLLEQSHAKYQSYHEQLRLSHSHLETLLSSTTETLSLLASLSDSFKAVEIQTDAFREQCEQLLSEQKRYTALADDIEQNARYYTYLEPITRRLNAPGAANLVKGRDFPEMLTNLDNCLTYMETHPQHAESAHYRTRYRLLLTRGLTLIRHHFTSSLGSLASEISKRIATGQLKSSTYSTLLYAKFRVPAPELKALGVEIQKRAVPTPDDVDAGREPEYASLLRELYTSYATTRGRLILPLVSRKMTELAANSVQQHDVLSLAKAALSYMRGICLDEYDLWFEWFESEGELYDFLESLMDASHDALRPRVIHETKLEKLCDLCAMIQSRYMDVGSDDDDDDDDDGEEQDEENGDEEDDESGTDREGHEGVRRRSEKLRPRAAHRQLNFAILAQPTLQDAQTRLVFLALAVLRDGIENYKPTGEDLDWPKINKSNPVTNGPVLSGTRSTLPPALPVSKFTEDVTDDAESVFSKQLTGNERPLSGNNWYPTFRKAIWLLRKIYRLVNSTVFDDLAHRIVHSTIQSFMFASTQITKQKTVQDGQLFLITHLLQLKQQIVAFDIEFVPPEVEFDFSSMTNTFYELRERGSLWNPVSWVRLVGGTVGGGLLPKVVENMLDAKAELDGRLRAVINDFVGGYANHISAPIEPGEVAKAKASKDGFDAVKAMRTVRGLAEKDVPALRAKLEEFVADSRTRETLVAAVRDQVVTSYEDFYDAHSDGKGFKSSRKGKAREDEVWGTHLFSQAMDGVFRVGQVVGDVDDGSRDDHQVSD